MQLSDFKALSFDCYGTLIDWETGISEALRPLAERSGKSAEELIEAHGPIELELEQAYPQMRYSELLERVHERLCDDLGVDRDEREAAAFGQSIGDWPAFPDSAEALSYLKGHFQLVILSNVDRRSFAGSNRRLGVEFDHIFTAEDIGSYKPTMRNFEYLLEHLGEAGIGKGDLLHVAQSLFHDHVPANRLGIASAWIDGSSGPSATLPLPLHLDERARRRAPGRAGLVFRQAKRLRRADAPSAAADHRSIGDPGELALAPGPRRSAGGCCGQGRRLWPWSARDGAGSLPGGLPRLLRFDLGRS
jgi:2-haloacid dehalogenase